MAKPPRVRATPAKHTVWSPERGSGRPAWVCKHQGAPSCGRVLLTFYCGCASTPVEVGITSLSPNRAWASALVRVAHLCASTLLTVEGGITSTRLRSRLGLGLNPRRVRSTRTLGCDFVPLASNLRTGACALVCPKGGGRKEPRRKTPELHCSGCALVWVNLSANSLATDLWVVA